MARADAQRLVLDCQRLKLRIRLDRGQVVVRGWLADSIRARIRECREDLIQLLTDGEERVQRTLAIFEGSKIVSVRAARIRDLVGEAVAYNPTDVKERLPNDAIDIDGLSTGWLAADPTNHTIVGGLASKKIPPRTFPSLAAQLDAGADDTGRFEGERVTQEPASDVIERLPVLPVDEQVAVYFVYDDGSISKALPAPPLVPVGRAKPKAG